MSKFDEYIRQGEPEERIAFMSNAYDKLRKLVTELAEKAEELDVLTKAGVYDNVEEE